MFNDAHYLVKSPTDSIFPNLITHFCNGSEAIFCLSSDTSFLRFPALLMSYPIKIMYVLHVYIII